jgi:predicted Zn-dependent peptidase
MVFVDRPGSVQTELIVAATGPDRRVDGGWAPYPVLGFVLGGSPNARVDAVLREEKGYTYGIRSVFRPRRRGGLFLTSGSVRGDVTVEALDILLTILDGARQGFTDVETKQGVDYIAMTAASRYATADAIADEAASLALEGLTTEFTTATLRDLADVDADRLGAAYTRFVDGDWTVVVVGDATAHADGIRALDHAAARNVTVVPG